MDSLGLGGGKDICGIIFKYLDDGITHVRYNKDKLTFKSKKRAYSYALLRIASNGPMKLNIKDNITEEELSILIFDGLCKGCIKYPSYINIIVDGNSVYRVFNPVTKENDKRPEEECEQLYIKIKTLSFHNLTIHYYCDIIEIRTEEEIVDEQFKAVLRRNSQYS